MPNRLQMCMHASFEYVHGLNGFFVSSRDRLALPIGICMPSKVG